MTEETLADSARKTVCDIESAMLLRRPRRRFSMMLFDVRVPDDTDLGDVSYGVEFARSDCGSDVFSNPSWGLWYVKESGIGTHREASIGRLRQAPLEVQLAFLAISKTFIEDWMALLQEQPDPHSLDEGRHALGLLNGTPYLGEDGVLYNGDGTPSELKP